MEKCSSQCSSEALEHSMQHLKFVIIEEHFKTLIIIEYIFASGNNVLIMAYCVTAKQPTPC